jgi:uncharacterized protein
MVLDRLREGEAELRKLGVDSLSLFGSVARDEENDASDIDLAVKFNQDIVPQGLAYFGFLDALQERLQRTLGRRVDVVPEPTAKASIQREIDRDRVLAF